MTPMKLDYMRRMRWWLKLVDAWPSEVLGEKVKIKLINYKILAPAWWIILFLQMEYIRENTGVIPIIDIGHNYVTLLLNFICCNRIMLLMTKSYKMLTKEFVQNIHLIHHKKASDYALKTYKSVNKYCTIALNFLQVEIVFFPLLYNLRPVLLNYYSGMYSSKENRPVNGTYEHSLYYATPIDISTNFRNYCFALVMDIICPYWVTICICIFDYYLSVLVCHIWGHIKILEHELRHFCRPTSCFWYTLEESEEVSHKLKLAIKHHRLIAQFTKSCSSTFGPILALYYAFHQVCCCILLLECSNMTTESLIAYAPLTMLIFQQLIQISIMFEFLGLQSESLTDAVYSLPWECMGVRERRIFLFFFNNAQKPIHIKALGLVPVGVQTMAAIIRTSITYFIMLRTFAK